MFVPASYSVPNFSLGYNFPNFSQIEKSEIFSEQQAFADFLKDINPVLKFLKAHLFWVIFFASLFLFIIIIIQILSWLSKPALIKLVELKETQDKNPSLIEGLQWGQKYFFRYVLAGWCLWIPYLILISIPIIGLILSLLMLFKNVSLSLASFFLFLFLLLILALLSILFSLTTELVHRKVVIENKKVLEAVNEGLMLFFKEWQKVALIWLISLVVSFAFGLLFLIVVLPLFLAFISSTFFLVFFKSQGSAFLFFVLIFSVFLLVLTTVSLFAKAISGTLLTNYWTLSYLEIQKAKQTLLQPSLPLETET